MHILFYVIVQLLCMNFTDGKTTRLVEDIIYNTTDENLVRSKRAPSPLPNRLKLRISDQSGEMIDLVWIRRRSFLANEHLPIFLSGNQFKNQQNIMQSIGEFVVYHDDEKNSAVVYFQKTNTLSGYVGLDYTIRDLPYFFDEHGNYLGEAAQSYIIKRLGKSFHDLPIIPNSYLDEVFSQINDENDMENFNQNLPSTSSKLPRFKRDLTEKLLEKVASTNITEINHRIRRWNSLTQHYYLEVLLFISHNIADKVKKYYGEHIYLNLLIKRYIIFFNAVDMIFRKMRGSSHEMFINIAGVIIEEPENLFILKNDAGEVQFIETLQQVRQYLPHINYFFPQDSFDYIFISINNEIKYNTKLLCGISQIHLDLYNAKKSDTWYNIVPITAAISVINFADAVHEMSRLLHIHLDPWYAGCSDKGQCYGIMQRGGAKCKNCLEWSVESREEYSAFFKYNIDRCFLLNEPRSLRPFGPSRFLTPLQQCQCYGFDSYISFLGNDYVSFQDCDKPLTCKTDSTIPPQVVSTIKPMDGTICGGSNEKVCWLGYCRNILSNSCTVDRKMNNNKKST